MAIPLLLDTDIGTDVDDAVCLAYLLCHPECELLGVTTVSGQPDKRAMLVDAICREAGKPVPVYAGLDDPMIVEPRQTEVPQTDALVDWRHARVFPSDEAISFMAEMIQARPGEVTLLTIGPLTNVGVLFETVPQIAGQLKQIVMMCGVVGEMDGVAVEWNAKLDPHALDMVCKSGVPSLTMVGLNVTKKVVMTEADFRERCTGGVLDVVASCAEVWFRERDRVTFHDPLAGALVFQPDLCTFRNGNVTVDTNEGDKLGATLFEERDGGTHRVAVEVDADRFFKHYWNIATEGS
jgi:inosine-uridine nucleoside N-ribohydrolase